MLGTPEEVRNGIEAMAVGGAVAVLGDWVRGGAIEPGVIQLRTEALGTMGRCGNCDFEMFQTEMMGWVEEMEGIEEAGAAERAVQVLTSLGSTGGEVGMWVVERLVGFSALWPELGVKGLMKMATFGGGEQVRIRAGERLRGGVEAGWIQAGMVEGMGVVVDNWLARERRTEAETEAVYQLVWSTLAHLSWVDLAQVKGGGIDGLVTGLLLFKRRVDVHELVPVLEKQWEAVEAHLGAEGGRVTFAIQRCARVFLSRAQRNGVDQGLVRRLSKLQRTFVEPDVV